MIGDFVQNTLSAIMISWFDRMVYAVLSTAYSVFLAVSKINLFATEGGQTLYSTITKQLYSVIGIAMIFVFAYQLILLVINPDGNGQGSPSKLFKDTVVSIIFVIVLPTLFNYTKIFQDHVLANNTIPAIVFGTNATTDVGASAGDKLAMMVYTAFYHPHGTDYSTFYGEDGELRDAPKSSDCSGNETTCASYFEALQNFESSGHKISKITGVKSLRHAIDADTGMDYMWIISTVCGCVVIWFFISYSIDIGVRAVKLGFLQLIAPIPIIMRVFPNSKKTFTTWLGEIVRTYVEIFLRLAVIFFIVRLCQLVPEFINAIFTSNDDISDSALIRCVATVCLILGLLKFAKDAPELIKAIFSTNGGLFSGLNLKPGVTKRMEENTFGMKAIGAGLGAAAGMIGSGVNQFNQSRKKNQGGGNSFATNAKAIGAGLVGATRGMLAGGKHGATNQSEKFDAKSILKATNEAAGVARNKAGQQTAVGKGAEAVVNTVKDMKNAYGTTGVAGSLDVLGDKAGDIGKKIAKPFVDEFNTITGKKASGDAQQKVLNEIRTKLSQMVALTETDEIKRLKQQKAEFASHIGEAGYEAYVPHRFTKDDINSDGTMSEKLRDYFERQKAVNPTKYTQAYIDSVVSNLKNRNGFYFDANAKLEKSDIGTKEYEEYVNKANEKFDQLISQKRSEESQNKAVLEALQKQAADINKILKENSGYIPASMIDNLSQSISAANGASIETLLKGISKKSDANGTVTNLSASQFADLTQAIENASYQTISSQLKDSSGSSDGDKK